MAPQFGQAEQAERRHWHGGWETRVEGGGQSSVKGRRVGPDEGCPAGARASPVFRAVKASFYASMGQPQCHRVWACPRAPSAAPGCTCWQGGPSLDFLLVRLHGKTFCPRSAARHLFCPGRDDSSRLGRSGFHCTLNTGLASTPNRGHQPESAHSPHTRT